MKKKYPFTLQQLRVAANYLAKRNEVGDTGFRRSRQSCPLCQITGYATSEHSDLRECRCCPNMAFAILDKYHIMSTVPCNQRPDRYNAGINTEFWHAIVLYLTVNPITQKDYFNASGEIRPKIIKDIKLIHKYICDGKV